MSNYDEGVGPYPMRVQVLSGSKAEALHYRAQQRHDDQFPERKALAAGVRAAPEHDLVRRGGKIIPKVVFQNVYLGKATARRQGTSRYPNKVHGAEDPRL